MLSTGWPFVTARRNMLAQIETTPCPCRVDNGERETHPQAHGVEEEKATAIVSCSYYPSPPQTSGGAPIT